KTATAGSDYIAASGTLTFAPGEFIKTITVQVKGDTLKETDESFAVNLSTATNATIGDAQGVCVITNDDSLPAITGFSVPSATVVLFTNNVSAEFNVNDTGTQVLTIVPAGAATGKVSVVTPNGTALSAIVFKVSPGITGFDPPSGPAGTRVTITGTSFTTITS